MSGDINLVLKAAMASALLNQAIYKLRDMEYLWQQYSKFCLGFSIYHSGSAMVFHTTSNERQELVYRLLTESGDHAFKITATF